MHAFELSALNAQLTNKIRWAINSSLKEYSLEKDFRTVQSWGQQYADDVLEKVLSLTSGSLPKLE